MGLQTLVLIHTHILAFLAAASLESSSRTNSTVTFISSFAYTAITPFRPREQEVRDGVSRLIHSSRMAVKTSGRPIVLAYNTFLRHKDTNRILPLLLLSESNSPGTEENLFSLHDAVDGWRPCIGPLLLRSPRYRAGTLALMMSTRELNMFPGSLYPRSRRGAWTA
ncbi:hypothetical protein D9619_011176 [Psilocybe cf. subviscida]|uniref:Uncharacterized protein n=1 Tax=Psilocybe cf. subviscida TaxID=2480587 RepID=A0A8H5BIT3_9AGAR|nr:hypothetical protein D9619_011176 [Psilocybe cf. subviscida]